LWASVLTVGGQAIREPKGLVSDQRLRPDLQIVFPGCHLLSDVVIAHPFTSSRIKHRNALGGNAPLARLHEKIKTIKYKALTAQQQATFIPFAAETCGGLGPQALKLLKLLAEQAREHLSIWPHHDIVGHMLGAVAVAIQKGNAMAVLAGFSNALMTETEVTRKERESQGA